MIRTQPKHCRSKRARFFGLAMIGVALFATDAFGREAELQEKRGIISVFALGEESVLPDVLKLDFFIKGEAAFGVDAVTKYRDSVMQIRESLQKLEIVDVKIEDGGLILLRRRSENGRIISPAIHFV